jgi:2-oxoglutarate-dependent dioxygenase
MNTATAAGPSCSPVQPLTLTEAEVRFYNDQGFLPLPGLVRGDQVAHLREEILDVLAANGVSRAQLTKATSSADKLRQCLQYLAGSKLDALINGQATLAVASQLCGGPAHVYLPFTAVKSAGGGGVFDFHQDNNYTQHDPAVGSINIWVALVDMTPENGCLLVVPGSHKQGQLVSRNSDDGDGHQKLDVDPKECFPVRMRAGDAVAFTRWTVHGSGPNTTDQPRVAYALQYHRHDVQWLDKQSGEWKRLVDSARWSIKPVAKLGPVDA